MVNILEVHNVIRSLRNLFYKFYFFRIMIFYILFSNIVIFFLRIKAW